MAERWLQQWHAALTQVSSAPLWLSLQQPDSVAAMIEQVHSYHVDSAPLYLRYRCWTLLLWQPVYLSVAAVNDGHALLPLDNIRQRCQHGSVYGFQQLLLEPSQQPLSERLQQQASWLQNYAQQAMALLPQELQCKPKHLWGLLADLLWLALQAGWQSQRQRDPWYQQGLLWQQAVLAQQPLAGQRDLIYQAQLQHWQIQRGSCCFAYLNPATTPCEGCPKQQAAARRAITTNTKERV